MSLLTLKIRVFKFNPKLDYNPAYVLYNVEYRPDGCLKEVLESIPDLAYDSRIWGSRSTKSRCLRI
ncbi:hypothetical protein NHP21005_01830 [Helicobacter sp. NHP21005]|uniref:hypothetical protein n=1 Tax=Helicobacter felistomachi TaxID=3040201 RepID=UPI002573CB28|nr:hypothetical protein [Helicobacter sp. NHP21005]BEG56495.1 hypothetical protein NHP21005_01830 [Helicobacter sp. NHP21005]